MSLLASSIREVQIATIKTSAKDRTNETTKYTFLLQFAVGLQKVSAKKLCEMFATVFTRTS